MSTTQAIPLPADHPGLGHGVRRLRERLFSLLRPAGSGVPANWQDFDPNPQDLIHEHRPVDRADEYRRQAVDRALAGCPCLR